MISDGKVVVIESPPGVGKTKHAVREAFAEASGGAVVVYAVATHSALSKAFSYALREFDAAVSTRSGAPYLVYYEGAERYCPFLRGEADFPGAVDSALSSGRIDPASAEEAKRLGAAEVARRAGVSFICRRVCPLWRVPEGFFGKRVHVPASAWERLEEAAPGLLSGLEASGHVARHDPGSESPSCIRPAAILAAPATGRAVIFAPVQALGQLRSAVESQKRRKRGLRSVYVVDEYDSLIYRGSYAELSSLEAVEAEGREAAEVLEQAVRALGEGDVSPKTVYTALAAAVAKHAAAEILRRAGELGFLLIERAVEGALSELSGYGVDPEVLRSFGADPRAALRTWYLITRSEKPVKALVRFNTGVLKACTIGKRIDSEIARVLRAAEALEGSRVLYSVEEAGRAQAVCGGVRCTGEAYSVKLFSLDAALKSISELGTAVLLSATGFPWLSRVVWEAPPLGSLVEGVEYLGSREESVFHVHSLRIRGREFEVYVHDPQYISAYVSVMGVSKDFEHEPADQGGAARLARRVDAEVKKMHSRCGHTRAVMVVCQRKDAAELLARELGRLGHRVQCLDSGCSAFSASGRVVVTWFRSRYARGVDLPEGTVVEKLFVLGSSYRPPTKVLPVEAADYILPVTALAYIDYVSCQSDRCGVVVSALPFDMAEAVAELLQVAGRALRSVARANASGRCSHTLKIYVPPFMASLFPELSPPWFGPGRPEIRTQ